MDEEDKGEFEIRPARCGEYSKELLLGFEKEVLGIYVSGHPLEEYEADLEEAHYKNHGGFRWMRKPGK